MISYAAQPANADWNLWGTTRALPRAITSRPFGAKTTHHSPLTTVYFFALVNVSSIILISLPPSMR